jgi:hypothetical protein
MSKVHAAVRQPPELSGKPFGLGAGDSRIETVVVAHAVGKDNDPMTKGSPTRNVSLIREHLGEEGADSVTTASQRFVREQRLARRP